MLAAKPPISILICALGGEGGGVLAEWLVATATACGHAAQGTSIPGVAQRTGATTYYIEIARDAGFSSVPIFSLYPVPGALDLFVASELVEAVRQVSLGFVTRERTHTIASSERTLTTHEKMQLADGRASSELLAHVLRDNSARLDMFAMGDAARGANTAISSVMLGAIAASGVLPFSREAYEQTIRRSGKGVEASLAGFTAGLAGPHTASPELGAAARALDADAIIAAGHARTREYQDAAYAKTYLDRVATIAAMEKQSDPRGSHAQAATREAARFLAAWMAFDDIVRVADLKIRAQRIERVHHEVRAGERDVVRVYDHFKPRVPEIAALLPQSLAERLLRYDRKRASRGKEPFALALKLPTHSVVGMIALRVLASLKGLRVRGQRFAAEQALIERWLSAVREGLARDWSLGYEIALCGRLVKGYGATNERGKDNLLHIIDHLAASAHFSSDAERAAAIRTAREAALADDAGRALDRTLVEHGAPPRPIKAQPIVFVRKREAA
ncbi:MAG TPA: DUF6537 domain-containing protein [Casimicrobiaceae bacterium]|nr:DUF6537 domain-containing protein [Casimicrobiaceae bacterium]